MARYLLWKMYLKQTLLIWDINYLVYSLCSARNPSRWSQWSLIGLNINESRVKKYVISPKTWIPCTFFIVIVSHCLKLRELNCNNHSTTEVQMCILLNKAYKRFIFIGPSKDFMVVLLYWLFFLENWLGTILFQTSIVHVITITMYLLDLYISVDLPEFIV